MKKIKFNFYMLSIASLVAFTSCEKEYENDYPAQNARPVGTLTVDNAALLEADDATTMGAMENVASYTLTMDEAYKTDMKFKVEFVASQSTGTLADFETNLAESPIDNGSAGYLITIAKNTTSANFTISTVFDVLPETAETLTFRLLPVADLNGSVAETSKTFTITIGNSISNDLNVTLDWEGSRTYVDENGDSHDFKDFDFDLEIYNTSSGTPVATSYSSSPEDMDFDSSLPDGTYYIVPSFWSAAGAAVPALPINFKVKMTVAKPGVFVKDFDLSGIWNSTIGGNTEGNPDAYQVPAYFIKTTVGSAAMYELYDYNDDTLLASGKMASLKAMLATSGKKSK